MKKTLLALAACTAIFAAAQVNAAPAATTPAATPAPAAAMTSAAPAAANSSQQNRMKTCAAQYHAQNLPKSQYKTFMSGCLKNPSTAPASTTMKPIPNAAAPIARTPLMHPTAAPPPVTMPASSMPPATAPAPSK